MDNDGNHKVSSELYSEFNYATDLTPTLNQNNTVSKFPFTYPAKIAYTDSDGDLVVQRKLDMMEKKGVIEIEHSKSTTLGLVGLQVWRGALLLADWLLENGNNLSENTNILELGSGTGLTSIVASMYACVICTDIDKGDILNLIKSNIARNKTIVKYPITVGGIDFTKDLSLNSEMMSILPKVQIILAADVIYDDELTGFFIKTIENVLNASPNCTIYVALEKRFIFTIEDCDTVAPCYEYFLDCLKQVKCATATQVNLDFPRYFEYDRVKELVLWKITCTKNS